MTKTEADFISSIDCRFPYHDPSTACELVTRSCEISPNAALMVAYELSRPPRYANSPTKERLYLLTQLKSRLLHPLADSILTLAQRLIREEQPVMSELI